MKSDSIVIDRTSYTYPVYGVTWLNGDLVNLVKKFESLVNSYKYIRPIKLTFTSYPVTISSVNYCVLKQGIKVHMSNLGHGNINTDKINTLQGSI